MKKLGLWAASAFFGGLAATSAFAGAMDDIKARGKLICGISTANPPFGFLDLKTNQISGYEIDLCKMVAAKLGVQPELKEVSGAGRVPELLQGRIDIVAQLLSYNAERAAVLEFSGQYVREGFPFIVKADSPIKSVDELAGKRVGVVAGSFLEPLIPTRLPTAKVIAFEGQPANFLALTQGKVDSSAMRITQALALEQQAGSAAKIRTLDGDLTTAASAFGVKMGEAEWRDFLNAFLTELETNGEGQKLWDKWLGANRQYKITRNFKLGGDVR